MTDIAFVLLDEWGFWLTILGLMLWAAWCDHKQGGGQ